jgi:hypothetical protein
MKREEAIYSKAVRTSSRMFFFDVFTGTTGDFLQITESQVNPKTHQKHRATLTIFDDTISVFLAELLKALNWFELDKDEFLGKLGEGTPSGTPTGTPSGTR